MVAADVFRRKYSHLQMVIPQEFPMPGDSSELLNVAGMKIDTDSIGRANEGLQEFVNKTLRVLNTQIRLQNGDQILDTFKHFGHAIERLRLETFGNRRLQAEFIGYLINRYSSESLIDVTFGYNAEKLIDYIKKPLLNVKKLSFEGNDMHFKQPAVALTELFPFVSHLNLYELPDDGLGYIVHHMPYLKHVSITRTHHGCEKSPFSDFIFRNPQIKSIRLNCYDPKIVQMVSIRLPQLKTLELPQFTGLQYGSAEFKHVTTLSLGFLASPNKLHFPRLRTLHIDYNDLHFDEYRTFLNEHTHLDELNLEFIDGMNSLKFQQIIGNLENLVELTLKKGSSRYEVISSDSIAKILRSHDKMMRFNLMGFGESFEIELQEKVKNDWNIRIKDNSISFERMSGKQITNQKNND